MSQEFKIEIISPDRMVYSSKTDEVILPCYEGQVTILKDHIPLITFLRPGFIEVGKNEKFYVEDGTVEFTENNLLVLSTTVQNIKNLKNEQINTMLSDAEKKLLNNQVSDKQRYVLNYKIATLKEIN
ncbi:ATP synthase F1 subunit epsilon [Pelagibacteraceae bacterium]|nr:ATP synthase F1 subunit epsilon [Pelagibacteraceae bacterium]